MTEHFVANPYHPDLSYDLRYVPSAPAYVVSRAKVLSGVWPYDGKDGRCSEAWIIQACVSATEARQVRKVVKDRADVDKVRVFVTVPRVKKGVRFIVVGRDEEGWW